MHCLGILVNSIFPNTIFTVLFADTFKAGSGRGEAGCGYGRITGTSVDLRTVCWYMMCCLQGLAGLEMCRHKVVNICNGLVLF